MTGFTTHIKGGQGFAHALLNKVVCNPTRWMLVKNGVHQGNLGGAAPGLSFSRTELPSTMKHTQFVRLKSIHLNASAQYSKRHFSPGNFRSSFHPEG